MNSVPRVFRPKVASKCCSVISPERDGFAQAGVREKNVDVALFPLDRIEQPVEVVEIGGVAAHAGDVAGRSATASSALPASVP